MTIWDFMNEHWIVGPATLFCTALFVSPCAAWMVAAVFGQVRIMVRGYAPLPVPPSSKTGETK